jgi:glycosyltransferase involved in cell wall biosynthesis
MSALLDMTDRDHDNQVQDELRELNERYRKLQARVDSLAHELVLVRRQIRRPRLWPRPPLMTFEQHAPIKLRVNSDYHKEKMPTDAVSFAIVTPSLNHAKYLAATIDSVLGQNYPRLSYTVQDGGSSDNTLDILQAYGGRLTWRSERDGGQTQAINSAFATCEGDIMAYLNSDDTLLPGTLAYVARVFQRRPDIDIVYGHRIFIDRDGMEVGRAVLPRHDRKAIHWADYIPQETMFWRCRVWDTVGKFDESFEYALDWDFILRAQQAGFKFLRVPRFLACFRVHDDQKTSLNYDRGREEMQRLRNRYIGYEPSHQEIIKNYMPYLLRQFAVHWMYRFGLLRF